MVVKNILKFEALAAHQSANHEVVMIRANAEQINAIAQIERLGRKEGKLTGFQRPQIAGHITEIRNYLAKSDAVLPNALVLAFVDGAKIIKGKGSVVTLEVDVSNGKPALVVDGQQRLTALTQTRRDDFEVFVACLICKDMDELRRQFILINNTKPLPKSLIYELLPSVENLPERLSSRALAAAMTERLNFDDGSSLKGMVKMQTNPSGIIRDTILQKAIMNSESAGAIQTLAQRSEDVSEPVALMSNFYAAVKNVFADDWVGHDPKTSRLVHGAGVIAMGYVMDEIYTRTGKSTVESFAEGLQPLVGATAWTAGEWNFGANEIVPWNRIEYTPRQYVQLAEHLVGILRKSSKVKSVARSR
ncbi:MAG: DGQHR domain-containing protein DpdB [Rhodoferax sp.]|nr:DGQHR domain-containing protein DpdB [Rhodoferax sp.]MDP3651674.1 DGQHR domain-containing protein DpdB [Rhodoferax sp.]